MAQSSFLAEDAQALVGLTHPISLSLEGPKLIGIIGPNGAGKSSLLRLCAGLNHKSNSSLAILGHQLFDLDPLERARRIAYLPQSPPLPSSLTVNELIEQGLYPHRGQLTLKEAHQSLERAVDTLALSDLRTRQLSSLSGGEQRKAFIARTLTQSTPIILLDEPLANLDWAFQEQLMRLFCTVREERSALIIITMHSLNLAALYTDELILLSRGELIAQGAPKQLMNNKVLERAFGAKALMSSHPFQDVSQRIPWGPKRKE